ncbi:MAG: ubiG 1 [Frankiales bacterium]|nr:ubiG 1 [Frankiales bacterium]
MIAVEACPLCSTPVGGLGFEVAGLRLNRCAACRVVHALEHADPTAIYVDGYHSGAHGFHLDADREPFATYVRQVDARRVAQVRRLVPAPARWLDVGCGRGRLLAHAEGYEAVGLEPVDETAEQAREAGLDVRTGVLEDAPEPGTWDVVTAFHVLEHVTAVDDALGALRRLLRPGGTLVVEVPNWRSLCRREAGDRWSLLSPGEHITFFHRSALRLALESTGFTRVRVTAPSWVNEPQTMSQALVDLGLRSSARLLGPLHEEGHVTAMGWRVLKAIDRLEARAGIGMTLLATGTRAA